MLAALAMLQPDLTMTPVSKLPNRRLPALAPLAVALCAAVWLAAMPETAAAQAAGAASAASAPIGPTVRPEFGAPASAAQQLLKEGKATEALAKLKEAEAVPNLSPYETMVLHRTRAAVAQKAGDKALTVQSLEAALATGLVDKAEETRLVEALVSIAWDLKDHPRVMRWSQRYAELNGSNDSLQLLRIQSQAATGDERGAAAALRARIEAAGKAGKPAPESHMRLLLSYERSLKDDAAALSTLGQLARIYPRPEYWSDTVSLAARDPALDDRTVLEMYRLLRATGSLKHADLRHEMAQIAQKLGLPVEALTVLDEGVADGITLTPAQRKLHEQLGKQAAADKADRPGAEAAALKGKDGNALVGLGWAMVAELPQQAPPASAERGLTLLEQGIAKGGLKRSAEARLHLGMAQLAAGKRDAARQTLDALAGEIGKDPLAPSVRLWQRFASAPPMLPPKQ
jgi:hypothetical protein